MKRCTEPHEHPGVSCDRQYNEIIIPTSDWEAALPKSIYAVMCLSEEHGTCDEARSVHRRLINAYNLHSLPLLRYRITDTDARGVAVGISGFEDITP